jgi:hypothetical protein
LLFFFFRPGSGSIRNCCADWQDRFAPVNPLKLSSWMNHLAHTQTHTESAPRLKINEQHPAFFGFQ